MTAHWIIGDGEDGREYIVHTAPPRFFAVVAGEGDQADRLDGIVFGLDDVTDLCEIIWIDDPAACGLSTTEDFLALFHRARAAIHDADDKAETTMDTL